MFDFGTDFTLDVLLDTTFLLRVHQLVTPLRPLCVALWDLLRRYLQRTS